MNFNALATHYQEALFQTIIPFWISYSPDTQCGGYYNALTDQGNVFDTDKVISLQAQQVWAFAWLYNEVDPRSAWLQIAQHGADFLERFGRAADKQGTDSRWLGIVDRRGGAIAPARTIIPDCFAAMAFGRLYQATADEEDALIARETIQSIYSYRQHQRKQWESRLGGFRELKHLAEPMMLLKALLETHSLLDPDWYKTALETVSNELLNDFFDKRLNLLLENVLPEGSFCDSVRGRRLHAGYAFETAGYLLEAAERTNNRRLAQQTVRMTLRVADICWDDPIGGFLHYADLKGHVSVFSEWDRKLWWTHSEALSTLIRGYLTTRHPDTLMWFTRVHDYTWRHFPDNASKEWVGVLNRTGEPISLCKATPDKGPYHLIKGLCSTWRALEQCAQIRSTKRTLR